MKHKFHALGDVLHLLIEGELDALQVDAESWERLRADARERARSHFGCTLYVDFRSVEFADSRSIFEVLDAIGVFRLGGEVTFVGPGPGIARLAKLGEAPLLAPMVQSLPEELQRQTDSLQVSEVDARLREAHEMEVAARAAELSTEAGEFAAAVMGTTSTVDEEPAAPENVEDIPVVALDDSIVDELSTAKTENLGSGGFPRTHGTPAENDFIETLRTAIADDDYREHPSISDHGTESPDDHDEPNSLFEVDLDLEERYLSSASDARDFVTFESQLEFGGTWQPIESAPPRAKKPRPRVTSPNLASLAATLRTPASPAAALPEMQPPEPAATTPLSSQAPTPRPANPAADPATELPLESGLERIRRLAARKTSSSPDIPSPAPHDADLDETDGAPASGSHYLHGLGAVVRSLGAAEARVGAATKHAGEVARAKDERIRELEMRLEAEALRATELARELEALEARAPEPNAKAPWEVEISSGLVDARRAFESGVRQYLQRGETDRETIQRIADHLSTGLSGKFSITADALHGDGGPSSAFRAVVIAGATQCASRPDSDVVRALSTFVLAAFADLGCGSDRGPGATTGVALLAETEPSLVPIWRVGSALAGEGSMTPEAWLDRVVRLSTGAAAGGPEREALKDVVDALGLYPPGTWVEMQSGEIGVVVAPTPGKPHAPRVLLQFRRRGDRSIPWTPRWFPDERGELASITRIVNCPRLREDTEPAPPVEAQP